MKLTVPQMEVLKSVAAGTPSGRRDVFARLHDEGLIDIADGGDGPWFVTHKGHKALAGSTGADVRMAADRMGSPYKCPTGYTSAAHDGGLCNCVSRRNG